MHQTSCLFLPGRLVQDPDVVALEAMHLEAEVPGMLHTEELEVRNFSGVEQRG